MGSLPSFTRRGFCLCCAASYASTGGVGVLSPRAAYAAASNIVATIRADAATATIRVHKLRSNISVLEGSGGNVGVVVGSDGKTLIDAGIAVSKPQMTEALKSLGDQPITRSINTHWHFDHANGNEWVYKEGASITAHENARVHLRTVQRVEDWSYDFAALAPGAVPSDVFDERKTLKANGLTFDLQYYGPAHTDSDICVRLVEADVLHVGDTFWNGIYPFIDYSTGGSIDGMIRAANANLDKAGSETIIIPGHGHPVSNRAELEAYRDMLVAIRDNVARLKKRETSLEGVIAAKPTAAFDAKWGRFVITPDLFTKLVYEGV